MVHLRFTALFAAELALSFICLILSASSSNSIALPPIHCPKTVINSHRHSIPQLLCLCDFFGQLDQKFSHMLTAGTRSRAFQHEERP